MKAIIEKAICEIAELEKEVPEGKHIITGDIRKLSSKLFRQLENKNIETVLTICEEMLEQRSWALGVIAFDFAYRVRSQYTELTYIYFIRG